MHAFALNEIIYQETKACLNINKNNRKNNLRVRDLEKNIFDFGI